MRETRSDSVDKAIGGRCPDCHFGLARGRGVPLCCKMPCQYSEQAVWTEGMVSEP